ncbi:MAG: TolC family protein, partial [Sulfurimonas sp.]|nr:TolC family protein [Sulfurimonas sp.]
MKKTNKPVEYTEKDYDFMNSLSSAILEQTPSRVSKVIKIWLVTIFLFIVWGSLAEIDEIPRGDGDVIPYGQNQVIQNLEGGIVESILIKEGETVKRGQIILKINNAKSTSSSKTNEMKFHELKAIRIRLYAEANQLEFKEIKTDFPELKQQTRLAKELYDSNKLEFMAKDNSIVQQIEQRKQEYKEAKARVESLRKSLEYVSEEISMTAPMVREGVKSKVDFLQLKREANGIENDIEAAELSLPRLTSAITEYRQKRIESKQLFIN